MSINLNNGIKGRTDGVAVAAGYVGENGYLAASATSVGSSGNYVNLITKVLQPGVWAVQGSVYINVGSATGVTAGTGAISLTSGTVDASPSWTGRTNVSTQDVSASTPLRFLTVSVATTVYLVARLDYSSAGTAAWSTSSTLNWFRIA